MHNFEKRRLQNLIQTYHPPQDRGLAEGMVKNRHLRVTDQMENLTLTLCKAGDQETIQSKGQREMFHMDVCFPVATPSVTSMVLVLPCWAVERPGGWEPEGTQEGRQTAGPPHHPSAAGTACPFWRQGRLRSQSPAASSGWRPHSRGKYASLQAHCLPADSRLLGVPSTGTGMLRPTQFRLPILASQVPAPQALGAGAAVPGVRRAGTWCSSQTQTEPRMPCSPQRMSPWP